MQLNTRLILVSGLVSLVSICAERANLRCEDYPRCMMLRVANKRTDKENDNRPLANSSRWTEKNPLHDNALALAGIVWDNIIKRRTGKRAVGKCSYHRDTIGVHLHRELKEEGLHTDVIFVIRGDRNCNANTLYCYGKRSENLEEETDILSKFCCKKKRKFHNKCEYTQDIAEVGLPSFGELLTEYDYDEGDDDTNAYQGYDTYKDGGDSYESGDASYKDNSYSDKV